MVYGNRTNKIRLKESISFKPETIYGINKLALETFIQKYSAYKLIDNIQIICNLWSGHKKNYQGIINVIISQIKIKILLKDL